MIMKKAFFNASNHIIQVRHFRELAAQWPWAKLYPDATAKLFDEYWTYSIDQRDYADLECADQAAAQKAADEDFDAQCEYEETRYDDQRDIEIVKFAYNEDGERVILQRVKSVVEFEYYHGDFAEHNTYGR